MTPFLYSFLVWCEVHNLPFAPLSLFSPFNFLSCPLSTFSPLCFDAHQLVLGLNSCATSNRWRLCRRADDPRLSFADHMHQVCSDTFVPSLLKHTHQRPAGTQVSVASWLYGNCCMMTALSSLYMKIVQTAGLTTHRDLKVESGHLGACN